MEEDDRDLGSDENEADNNDVCDEDSPSVSTKEQLSVEEKEIDSTEEQNTVKSCQELVNFRIVWNKKNYDVEFDVGQTVDKLKEHIQELTGINKHLNPSIW
jgi:cobalamin biosynthesis protein CobT